MNRQNESLGSRHQHSRRRFRSSRPSPQKIRTKGKKPKFWLWWGLVTLVLFAGFVLYFLNKFTAFHPSADVKELVHPSETSGKLHTVSSERTKVDVVEYAHARMCSESSDLVAPSKLLVIPDIHGDIVNLKKALHLGGVMDKVTEEWIGEDTFVIQTGDVFDRGPHTAQILRFFRRLQTEAVAASGCIVLLMGNHELMNIAGDFRYASAKETAAFGGLEGRKEALELNSFLGDSLRNLRIAVTITQGATKSVFAHAGLLPNMLESMGGTVESVNEYFRARLQSAKLSAVRGIIRKSPPMLEEGPLWNRFYAGPETDRMCETVEKSLELISADRMIIGHTVQSSGKPRFKCSNRLIMADTGLSRYYGGNVAILLMENAADSDTDQERGLRIKVLELSS